MTIALGVSVGSAAAQDYDSSGKVVTNSNSSSGSDSSPASTSSADSGASVSSAATSGGGGGDGGAVKPADPNAVQPMYDGMFKCTDGYDPDTDPALHPAGQDPKVRMLVNAQAQKAHDEKVEQEKAAKAEAAALAKEKSSAAAASASSSDAVKADKKNEEKKDDKKADKKDDKKSDDKKAEDKKPDDKDKDAKTADKKNEDDKKADEQKDSGPKEAYTPLRDALFAVQTGNYKTSVELLSKVIASNAKNVEAHYLLAVSYVGLRNYAEAATHYNLVLKLSPGTKLAELASQGLKQLH